MTRSTLPAAAVLLTCLFAVVPTYAAQSASVRHKSHKHGESEHSQKKPASGHAHAGASKQAASVQHGKGHHKGARSERRRAHMSHIVSVPTEQSRKLHSAFVASEQLRPMAQQLFASRSPAAFAGVENYAGAHPGEGAAAAFLSVGHAYAADHHYAEAASAFRRAAQEGEALRDYADYLGAQAELEAQNTQAAITLLSGFAERYPASIFAPTAPVLLANAYLQSNDPANALRVLQPLLGTPESQTSDFLLAEGKARQAAGDNAAAVLMYRQIYTRLPFSPEATQARLNLQALGAGPTAAERKLHADAMFNAHRYSEAASEYQAIQRDDSTLSQPDRDALEIYAAVCKLKLKDLPRREAERLPNTNDDSAALKLYILAEISRTEGDLSGYENIVQQMQSRFPQSRWLEEALYSAGNMFLVKNDTQHAIQNYALLVHLFPNSTYAPQAHWHTAWLNYRLRNYPEAARLMEEQVVRYPNSSEVSAALYWRGRMYEDPEHNPAQAANFYNALIQNYRNYFYGVLARERLSALGSQAADDPVPILANLKEPPAPTLVAALPENDPHLIKARLLGNAALNEYIAPEIEASGTSSQWGALAEAEIYTSFGENVRALQAIKHAGKSFLSLPVSEVPAEYWQLLYPRPYWSDLVADSEAQGLDPYLVASLIRQESEFNPAAVSRANAYGLMQLLPSVGKQEEKKVGMSTRHFSPLNLLNPQTNLKLGTANLKQVLGRFGNRPEYALAAYNAGDVPVRAWLSQNNYKDIPEFVESIPYTETREYVQAIVRNREMYRQLYSR